MPKLRYWLVSEIVSVLEFCKFNEKQYFMLYNSTNNAKDPAEQSLVPGHFSDLSWKKFIPVELLYDKTTAMYNLFRLDSVLRRLLRIWQSSFKFMILKCQTLTGTWVQINASRKSSKKICNA